MGNSASRTAKRVGPTVSKATASKPTTAPRGLSPNPINQGQASTTKSDAIAADSADPNLASMLRSVGPVGSRPHPSSTDATAWSKVNPAQRVLFRRQEIVREFEEMAEKKLPRKWVDPATISEVMRLRDSGWSGARIEERLELEKGFLERLGGSTGRIERA